MAARRKSALEASKVSPASTVSNCGRPRKIQGKPFGAESSYEAGSLIQSPSSTKRPAKKATASGVPSIDPASKSTSLQKTIKSTIQVVESSSLHGSKRQSKHEKLPRRPRPDKGVSKRGKVAAAANKHCSTKATSESASIKVPKTSTKKIAKSAAKGTKLAKYEIIKWIVKAKEAIDNED